MIEHLKAKFFSAPRSEQAARKLRLLTATMGLALTGLFIGGLLLYFFGNTRATLANAQFFAVGLAILLLFHPRSYEWKATLACLWMYYYVIWDMSYGLISGLQYVLLLTPALLFFLFETKWYRQIALATLAASLLFVWADFTFPWQRGWDEPFVLKTQGTGLAASDVLFVFNILLVQTALYVIAFGAFRALEKAEARLAREYARSERLLQAMLPARVAAQLKDDPNTTVAEHVGHATILFADLAGFTAFAGQRPASDTVEFLNTLFSAFDARVEALGLEKIKTIGDAYMVAGGLQAADSDHNVQMGTLALDMIEIAEDLLAGTGLALRIGMHCGPVMAGVIGQQRPFYDVWGDTVNVASRMEQMGEAGKVQITPEVMEALQKQFDVVPAPPRAVAGKGDMRPYWLLGRRESTN